MTNQRAHEKEVCPHCGSRLIQEITNGKKCAACGHQFAVIRDPISECARLARENAVGFPRRES